MYVLLYSILYCHIADINGLHVQLPKSFAIRHCEDNQATITLLLSGQAGALRHTDRTQKVSFGWLRQQYEEGHFRLLNVDTGEQVADVFTKPFTERSKWIHALKLIAHTTKTVDHAPDRKSNSAAAPASPQPTKISQEQVEDAARILNKAGRYDFDDFEQVTEMMYDALSMSNSRLRRCISTDDQKAPKYFVFGLWTHGGCFGITRRTQQFPNLCRYLNEFVKHHAPRSFTWSSLVVNFMGRAGIHSDKFNLKGSQNWSFGFGDYQGGELWVQQGQGPAASFVDHDQKIWDGSNLDSCRKPVLLNPHIRHAVQPFTGTRHSFIAYSSGGWSKLAKVDKQVLHSHGFRTPKAQLSPACVCLLKSPHDEGGTTKPPVFSSVEKRASFEHAQTYTTCTTALVELATPVSDASRGSQRVEVSTTPARMARLLLILSIVCLVC